LTWTFETTSLRKITLYIYITLYIFSYIYFGGVIWHTFMTALRQFF